MKRRPKSFQTKLWLYFVLFTAIIFSVLWLLQTVFLQRFYNSMLIANTRSAAEQIIKNAGNDDADEVIDRIARKNSVLVYVTDLDGNVLYIADEYKGAHKNSAASGAHEQGRGKGKNAAYRSLPDGYDAFLEELLNNGGEMTGITDGDFYVCGAYIRYYGASGDAVLYVGAALDAVGSAVTIIGWQLAVGTVFSLAVGFALAWFLARRFSQPVAQLAQKAEKLGEKKETDAYKKGFSAELDALNDTLDRTGAKLIKAREYQNELLANVSHDLRTPLTMIKGYAEAVADFSWQDERQRAEDLGVIIRECDRLTDLVNEILAYSELQAGGGAEGFIRFDMGVPVNRALDSFQSLFRREGGVIEREIEENVTVYGSDAKVERMAVNLLDNAVRHAGANQRVRVSLTKENGFAVLRVADRGEGIPPERLERIWERYYTNRQRGGKGVSGLGLAIVKQIADLHGGECDVQSVPGEGSTFTVRLPLADPDPE